MSAIPLSSDPNAEPPPEAYLSLLDAIRLMPRPASDSDRRLNDDAEAGAIATGGKRRARKRKA